MCGVNEALSFFSLSLSHALGNLCAPHKVNDSFQLLKLSCRAALTAPATATASAPTRAQAQFQSLFLSDGLSCELN